MGPAILVDLVSPRHQGKIQGWFMALTSLGGIAGPYVTGWLIGNSASQAAGFHHAFQLCGLILLVFGGLVWLAVRPKKFEDSAIVNAKSSEVM
jgi:MFS family permease